MWKEVFIHVRRTPFTGEKKHTREKRLNTCKRKAHVKIDLIRVQYDYQLQYN